jgi:hypothetical protein
MDARSPATGPLRRLRRRSRPWLLNRPGWALLRGGGLSRFDPLGVPSLLPIGERWHLAPTTRTIQRPEPAAAQTPVDASTERIRAAGLPTRAGWFFTPLPVSLEELPTAPDSHFVVHIRLGRSGLQVSGRPVSPRMLAQAVRSNPDWGHRPVVLAIGGRMTAAALGPVMSSLATALGVAVISSPGPVLLGPRILLADAGFVSRTPGSREPIHLGRVIPGVRPLRTPWVEPPAANPDPEPQVMLPTAGAASGALPAPDPMPTDAKPVPKVGLTLGMPRGSSGESLGRPDDFSPEGFADFWDTGSADVSERITGDVSGGVAAGGSPGVARDVPGRVASEVSEEGTRDVPGRVASDVSEQVLTDVSVEVASDVSAGVPSGVPAEVTLDIAAVGASDVSPSLASDPSLKVPPDVFAEGASDRSPGVPAKVASNDSDEAAPDLWVALPSDGAEGLAEETFEEVPSGAPVKGASDISVALALDLLADVVPNVSGEVPSDVFSEVAPDATTAAPQEAEKFVFPPDLVLPDLAALTKPIVPSAGSSSQEGHPVPPRRRDWSPVVTGATDSFLDLVALVEAQPESSGEAVHNELVGHASQAGTDQTGVGQASQAGQAGHASQAGHQAGRAGRVGRVSPVGQVSQASPVTQVTRVVRTRPVSPSDVPVPILQSAAKDRWTLSAEMPASVAEAPDEAAPEVASAPPVRTSAKTHPEVPPAAAATTGVDPTNPTGSAELTESTELSDPTSLITGTEANELAERADLTGLMSGAESAEIARRPEAAELAEPAGATGRAGSAELTGPAELAEPAEAIGPTEAAALTGLTGSTEPPDLTQPPKSTQPTESAENIKLPKNTEPAGPEVALEAVAPVPETMKPVRPLLERFLEPEIPPIAEAAILPSPETEESGFAKPEKVYPETNSEAKEADGAIRPEPPVHRFTNWIQVSGEGTRADREQMRALLGWRYEAHSRAVTGVLALQPGLRASAGSADLMVGLVAVYAHLAGASTVIDAVLRGEKIQSEGGYAEIDAAGAALLARCARSGLTRLPAVIGPVYRGGNPDAAQLKQYRSGQRLVEPAFTEARLVPSEGSEGTVEYAIWSSTARRTDRVTGVDGDAGTRVLFAPGTNFVVLDVVQPEEGGRLRVLLRELPPSASPKPDDPVDERTRERLRESIRTAHPAPASAQIPEQWRHPLGIHSEGSLYAFSSAEGASS